MDESLAMVCIDIGGRPFLYYQTPDLAGELDSLTHSWQKNSSEPFLTAVGLGYVRVLYGRNTHHMLEAVFKAFGRAMKQAVTITGNTGQVPSTKGVMD